MRIDIKQSDLNGQYYANIIANNGEIIFTSEQVHNKIDLISTIRSLVENFRESKEIQIRVIKWIDSIDEASGLPEKTLDVQVLSV